MAMKKDNADKEITEILKVRTGSFDCCIVGTSPVVLNRMSQKAQHELLMPRGRKTPTERLTQLKHIPVEEYRASAYTLKDGPALLALMATAFKGALRTAALDMPGAKKAQIGRLTWIEGELVGVFGAPKIYCAVVRSADMNKTPDIRTRAIVPAWACQLRVTFVEPLIRAQAVANLLAAAGLYVGVGDGRPEKGALNFGQFRIADKDDAEFKRIVKEGGRKAQQLGLDRPEPYDQETRELLTWFDGELVQRKLRGMHATMPETPAPMGVS